MMRWLQFGGLFLVFTFGAAAHEVRPALLKVSEVMEGRYRVHWKVPAMGNERLAIDPVFATQCEEAEGRVEGFASGASVRSWILDCEDGLADTAIGFANLPTTMIDVLVQVTFLDGRYYTGLARPGAPVFHVPARDSQASVFRSYFSLGVDHILGGWDHLLFVLGMVLLVTGHRRLIGAITGFTVAHSITLALASLEIIHVPGPPVEAVIALSIVLLAAEARRYQQTGVETSATRAPWLVCMGIGLIHGLGFAGALNEYGLPAYAQFVSLLAFNLGVETGQLIFIAALILLGTVARKFEVGLISPIQTATTWFVGICGSFWLVQRITGFFYP